MVAGITVKIRAAFFALLFGSILLVSCADTKIFIAEQDHETTDNPWTGVMDFSKQETIHILAPTNSEPPEDLEKVSDAINERMLQLINTKVKITLIPLSSWLAMYPVILSGGEEIDLIYTSLWSDYRSLAEKNAFMELSEDFIGKYMPVSAERMPENAWKQASLNEKIFAVPKSYTDSSNYGVVLIRKDIMEKLGIEDVNSFDDYENFLLACADDRDLEYYGLYAFSTFSTSDMILLPSENLIRLSDNFIWDADEGTFDPDHIQFLYCTQEYKDHCLKMAEWAEAGVWPKYAYASNTHIFDQFEKGFSYSILLRTSEVNNRINNARMKGLDVICRCLLDEGASIKHGSFNEDMFAIPVFSSKAERAAVCLDVLKYDPVINLLCQGGIEGLHYINNSDGTYSLAENAGRYEWSNWAWPLRTEGIYLLEKENEDAARVLMEMNTHYIPYDEWVFDGFEFDESGVQDELTKVNQIIQENMFNFDIGVYREETAEKYNEFTDRLYRAGLSRIIDEYMLQARKFCGANN